MGKQHLCMFLIFFGCFKQNKDNLANILGFSFCRQKKNILDIVDSDFVCYLFFVSKNIGLHQKTFLYIHISFAFRSGI